MNYRIVTDSCCDLPGTMYGELDVTVIPLSLVFRGETLEQFTDETIKAMYDGLRAGESASTAAANPERWASAIEPSLKNGQDVLVLAFSSGLSTTYQSAVIAADELKEKYPERRIRVVDTLCASLGQGLLLWQACKQRDAGLSLDDVAQWCESAKTKLCHWFTVDDLMHLKRGGRIGAGTALVGTMLGIKPILHVDDEGRLVSVAKCRGRKAAIDALAAKLSELGEGFDNSTVFISHGDCQQDAQYLAELLKQKHGVKEVLISYVGAVIGSHAGPGTLALFFMGKHR